ncbi:MAG: ArsA-related P-loop ATPase [Pseudomonadota bacterium]|nr:ArsA-related P-loop ATPase [Pseudomonadota bacterium]
MDEILKKYKVIICAGSGGVGKTTIAAALAVRAAESGMNVLVLTIDPSRRLATSLGISKDIDQDVFVPQQKFKGKLYAAVLNSKKTFDDFVMRCATNPEVAKKFMKNRLYIQMSTKLSGSQEFTAMERLYSSFESAKYDLIILDTPPTKHAVDFLRAPQKLNAMFTQSMSQWLIGAQEKSKSFFSRFLGPSQVFRILAKVTGAQFVDELVDFFQNIQAWQEKVGQRTIDVHRLLTSEKTGFVLISSFDSNKIEEAKYFYKEIQRDGHHLAGVIINRSLPVWGRTEKEGPSKLANYYEEFVKYYSERENSFVEFQRSVAPGTSFVRIPDFNQDVSGLESLTEISHLLVGGRA